MAPNTTSKRNSTAIRPAPSSSWPEYVDQVFENVRQELLAGIFPGTPFWESGYSNGLVLAPTDIEDAGKVYRVRTNIPGMRKENIEVTVHGRELLLEAKSEAEEQVGEPTNYLRRERTYRGFSRRFELPEDVAPEKIAAKYEDGVLTVEIPKAHPEPSKKIPVG